MAEKRREVKGKGEKESYTHLNAEFQRVASRDKKAFLGGDSSRRPPGRFLSGRAGRAPSLWAAAAGATGGLLGALIGLPPPAGRERAFQLLESVFPGEARKPVRNRKCRNR